MKYIRIIMTTLIVLGISTATAFAEEKNTEANIDTQIEADDTNNSEAQQDSEQSSDPVSTTVDSTPTTTDSTPTTADPIQEPTPAETPTNQATSTDPATSTNHDTTTQNATTSSDTTPTETTTAETGTISIKTPNQLDDDDPMKELLNDNPKITLIEDVKTSTETEVEDTKIKNMTIRRMVQTGTARTEMSVLGYIEATPIRIVVPVGVVVEVDQQSTAITSDELFIKNEGDTPVKICFNMSQMDDRLPIIPPDAHDDWENLTAEQTAEGIAMCITIGGVDYWQPNPIEVILEPGEEKPFSIKGLHGKVFRDAISFSHKFSITADLI
jgi:hypothetical protein